MLAKIMKTKSTLTLVALTVLALSSRSSASGLPPFSWDRVPVIAHVGKTSDDFSTNEVEFLAKHFNFVVVEKAQAVQKRGTTEAGIAEAARQIKQRNPKARVIFYWNSFLDIPQYKAHSTLPTDGHLKDLQGKPVMARNTVATLDLSREDVRNWWTEVAAKAVMEYGCDGIFADALPQVTAAGKKKLLGDEKYRALNDGLVTLLKQAREKMGSDKIIIYNGIRGEDGAQFLPLTDGAMIEHFNHFSSTGKVNMASDIEAMRKAGQVGKLVVMKAWPGFSWLDADQMKKPHEELLKLARERITFPLACFLVAAEANSFFCYTWGYRENQGTFDWYPEFDKPLGPPKGQAERQGWTYRREFEHASVFVDLEKQTAKIDWK
jgi:hypothetical protein